jgi:hypothetical protein
MANYVLMGAKDLCVRKHVPAGQTGKMHLSHDDLPTHTGPRQTSTSYVRRTQQNICCKGIPVSTVILPLPQVGRHSMPGPGRVPSRGIRTKVSWAMCMRRVSHDGLHSVGGQCPATRLGRLATAPLSAASLMDMQGAQHTALLRRHDCDCRTASVSHGATTLPSCKEALLVHAAGNKRTPPEPMPVQVTSTALLYY